MARKRLAAEQIVTKLRQIEVLQAQGKTIAVACKEAKTTAQLRDECLKGEIFYSLKEAQVIVEQWRIHYNTKRPHLSLGYRPPAPPTMVPNPTPSTRLQTCNNLS